MRRFSRLWSVVFCFALLVPGYALGAATFTFDHPPTIVVGQEFNLTVLLSATSPPANVHGYQYCFSYNKAVVELVPQDIPCTTNPTDPACQADPNSDTCIALPPADGGFFNTTFPYPGYRDCADNCTAPGVPLASNCSSCDPAKITYLDLGGFNPGEPPECVCEALAPFGPKLVSTYTFRAIAAGTTEFEADSNCTKVVDCEGTSTPPVVISPPIVVLSPSVPAFSGYGVGIFALVIAFSFILVTRRLKKSGRNARVLLAMLALGATLSLGLVFAGFASAAQSCPDECRVYQLDLNGDTMINVADVSILQKCIKSNCNDPAKDVNRDGIIDQVDSQVLLGCIKNGCYKVQ